jgi:hypothetical protein
MKGKIFFIIAVFFVLFSMYPTWDEVVKRDTIRPDRYFELVHNFYTDFNFYLSRIRQGLEGNISIHEKYTSEPHQGSYIHVMYLAMGWVGRFVRVPWHRTEDIYHMSRIVLGIVLILMMAEFAKRSFARFWWQITALLLAVTASTYPILVHLDDGSLRIGGYMPWWSVMDSLQRITFIPHLLAGQALLAFILFAASDIRTIAKPGNWFFLGIIGLLLGMILPPALVFAVAGMCVIIAVEFIFDWGKWKGPKFWPWLLSHSLPRAVIALISAPSLIYLQLMVSFYPWKQLALADILHPLPFQFWEYFQAVGPILPLGVLGLIIALIKKERRMVASIAWVFAWAACLFIFNFIPAQSPLRFSEMIVHLPLGMLACYLFMTMYQKGAVLLGAVNPKTVEAKIGEVGSNEEPIKNVFGSALKTISKAFSSDKTNPRKNQGALAVVVAIILPSALIILEIAHMHSSWLWQRDFVDHKIRAMYPLVPTGSYVMYPLNDFVNAIRWLQDNTSRDTVILSETTSGNYIPVYSGNTVYVGHENTVNSDEKKLYVKSFFSGNMPTDQAYKWLKEENLNYVFFGPQEKEDNGVTELSSIYTFLETAFKNDYVAVYHVK